MSALLAFYALLCQPAATQGINADLAIVRSARDLRDALDDGVRHIEIQAHLDLTDERLTVIDDRPYDTDPLYYLDITTRSIRVCSALCKSACGAHLESLP